MGVKTISTKLSREKYTRLQYHCEVNHETINAFLKRIILEEIDNPHPTKIAGKNIFIFNKNKDNFAWKVILDDNSTLSIDDNLPANTVEQLLESLIDAYEKRKSHIKKVNKNSVAIPSLLWRKNK